MNAAEILHIGELAAIRYKVAQNCEVQIYIYNMTGQELACWKKGPQPVGTYTHNIANVTSSLNMLITRIRIGKTTHTKKLISF